MSASIMSNSLQSRFNPCGYGSNWSAPSKWTVDTKKGKNCGFICAPILDPFAYLGFWTRGPKPLKMSNFYGPGGYPIWRDNQKIPKRVCLQTHLYIYIYTSLSNSSNIPAEATQVEQPSLLSVRRSATALQRMMVQVPIECLVKDVFPNGMWGFLAVALLLDLDMVFLGDRKLFCSILTRWFLDVFLGLRRSNLNSVKAT